MLLDIDGTLVDSNGAHARAWHDAMTEVGVEAPPVERLRRLVGMGADKVLPEAIDVDGESPLGHRINRRRSEIFREQYLPAVQPTPGAPELVAALEERGLRVGVATSASPVELTGLLERAGVPGRLADSAASAEEVDASKPEPDVVRAALDRIGLPPEDVILVGDTPYDVEAGTKAGVRVIGVRSGGWHDDDLAGAIAVFDHPADLVDHLDRTPLGGAVDEATAVAASRART